jgi:hypothetical protein
MAVLASPADRHCVRQAVNHLRRTAQCIFAEILLVLDTMPSRSFPAGDPATDELREIGVQMIASGEIDRVVPLDTIPPGVGAKHFTPSLRWRRDYRGIPLFGWIAGMEAAGTRYLFHSDSDILMHAVSGFSWIGHAIDVLRENEGVVFVGPRGGPQKVPNAARSRPKRSKTFSSRRFVVDIARYRQMLPFKALHVPPSRRLAIKGASTVQTWEAHVRAALVASPWHVHWLSDSRAWGLHAADHGPLWQKHYSRILNAVEQGRYPPSQIDDVNLHVQAWSDWIEAGEPPNSEAWHGPGTPPGP